MTRVSVQALGRYVLQGQICRQGCLRANRGAVCFAPRRSASSSTKPPSEATAQHDIPSEEHPDAPPTRSFHPFPSRRPDDLPIVPLRKQLKYEARALKAAGKAHRKKPNADRQAVLDWELTVGIEIHAQLNTACKLFSPAATPSSPSLLASSTSSSSQDHDMPNSRVALFDAAIPGSHPLFQPAVVVPAVRASLSLGCAVQRISRFDRKHYFHWDQPAGYQLTQFWEPLARDGVVVLRARDGIAAADAGPTGDGVVTVSIRQVQIEQDTAKTTAGSAPGEHLVDLNRAGVPLIEIITSPDIHYPATAAALVRKVQMLLRTVDACISGMEEGGLRADVNVSVRPTGGATRHNGTLGTRTEIKNLSSFKAVEDAIVAERDRQIAVLEAGGVVTAETRGWSLGSAETRRLRGKEGEVDYRYMPDPDIGPVIVGEDLVASLEETMGVLPDEEIDELVSKYGLSAKDALSLMQLENGKRIEYFYAVLKAIERLGGPAPTDKPVADGPGETFEYGRLVANWCLHELGKLDEDLAMTAEGESGRVPAAQLAELLLHLYHRRITAKVARELLWAVFRGKTGAGITEAINDNNLWFKELSEDEYVELVDYIVEGQEQVLREFLRFQRGQVKEYPQGKLMFLVGKMMRAGPEEQMDPTSIERVLKARIESRYLPTLRNA